MSAVYGIAGFVQGFIDGRDTRNRWDDRKLDRKRQERFDEIAVGQDKRAADEHARRMRIYDQQIAATDKSVSDTAEMEKVYAGSVDAANAAMEADAANPLPDGPAAPAGTPMSQMPSMPLGLPVAPNRAAAAMMDRMPADKLAAQAQAQALPSSLPLGLPGKSSGVAPPAALVAAAAKGPVRAPSTAAPAMGLPSVNDPLAAAGVKRRADGTLVAPAPSAAIADELYQQGPAGVRYLRTPDENAMIPGTKESADAAARKAAAEAEEANRRQKMILAGIAELPGTANAGIRTQAAEKLAAMTPASSGPPIKPGAVGPTVQNAPKAAPPASAPPMVRGLAQTAVDAMTQTATPAMQEATAAASKGMPAPAAGGAKSAAARDKYAKGFMDYYIEKGAPMVVEAFIKKGQFDKALAFQDFMQRQETKAGMDDWAKAAFAASVGDMDTFSKHIMSAYNRLDYFGDNTVIVEDQSGFTRDKAGNITGAKITFKDEKTGNTFDQVFTDPNDLVRMGITLLAPEQAFEYYAQQQQAAQQAAMGLTPKEAAEAAAKKDSETAKRVDDIAKTIYEGSKQLDGTYAMTYEEARRAAQQAASIDPSAPQAGGMPPVAYRP